MNSKSFTIAALAALVVLGGAWLLTSRSSTSQSSGTAKAVVNADSHNWGDIGINDGEVSAMFTITNAGDAPLILADGVTSCGCTTGKLSVAGSRARTFGMHSGNNFKVAVEPGGSAELEAIFDPLFHGPQGFGPITRQVTLQTNDPSQPELVLNASATVVAKTPSGQSGPAIAITPATQDLGRVVYGDVPTTSFTLANNSDQPLTITRITTSCSCTTAETKQTVVQAGNSTPITVAFNPAIHKDDTDLGELTRTIFIETDNVEHPKLSVDITANVVRE